MKGARLWALAALLTASAASPASVGPPAAGLIVACAGDSLMRPIPAHFRELAPAEGLALEIREWAEGGLSTETYSSFFRRLGEEKLSGGCDAVLLQLGTNDAVPLLEERWTPGDFRSRLAAILAEFKRLPGRGRPRPLLLLATVPPFCDRPESAAKNRIVETVLNPLIREIAAREGAVIVDNHAVLKDRPDLYDPDCVHPNADGEKALARSWLEALRRALEGPGAADSSPGAEP